MCWGGGNDQQEQQQPMYYYDPGPTFDPYQSFMGGGGEASGAGGLLGGNSNVPQVNSPGYIPTTGWSGAGNANYIPGTASQMLRMQNSPMYLW